MKKKLSIALVVVLSIVACMVGYLWTGELKEGDIVFLMSKSEQSPLVQYATSSPWSHCGVIIEKSDGLYVLEASNVVKLTPYKAWKARGRMGIVKSRRVVKEPVKIRYRKYLGTPYDLQFKFDNGKYYCSELVYDIYLNQLGIQLCKPKPIGKNHTLGLKKAMKKRGISTKQLAVAPCDLL